MRSTSTQRFRRSANGRSQILWNAARQRALKSGIPFTITREWLDPKVAAGRCEYTNLHLDLEPIKGLTKNPFAPSLDRIDNSLGYTPENTRLVAAVLNYAKNEWNDTVLAMFCIAFLRKWSNEQSYTGTS